MSVDVFISYHSKSSHHIAAEIEKKLEREGMHCWLSGTDLVSGPYADHIMDAIRECRVFLLILNQASSESIHVLNELEAVSNRLADKEDVVLLPFQIANEEISDSAKYHIQRHHWVNATVGPMEQHEDFLVSHIRSLLATEADLQGWERAKKKERRLIFGKLVITALLAALLYGALSVYDGKWERALGHVLFAASPVLLLMYEPHEKIGKLFAAIAGWLPVLGAAILILWNFDLLHTNWLKLENAQIVKAITAMDRNDMLYVGCYVMLFLYPGSRGNQKVKPMNLFWLAMCLGTAVWLGYVSVELTRMDSGAGLLLYGFGIGASAYMLYCHVVRPVIYKLNKRKSTL